MGRRVFISYRWTDTRDMAARLRDRLAAEFGASNVFLDALAIDAGAQYRQVIERSISHVESVIVLIGSGWDVRRLTEPSDPVHEEVLEALAQNKEILPVLVDATHMPRATTLPEDIRLLAEINPARLRPDPDFDRDVERIMDVLDPPSRSPDEPARRKTGVVQQFYLSASSPTVNNKGVGMPGDQHVVRGAGWEVRFELTRLPSGDLLMARSRPHDIGAWILSRTSAETPLLDGEGRETGFVARRTSRDQYEVTVYAQPGLAAGLPLRVVSDANFTRLMVEWDSSRR